VRHRAESYGAVTIDTAAESAVALLGGLVQGVVAAARGGGRERACRKAGMRMVGGTTGIPLRRDEAREASALGAADVRVALLVRVLHNAVPARRD